MLKDLEYFAETKDCATYCVGGESDLKIHIARFGNHESRKQLEDIKRKLYGFSYRDEDIDSDLVLAHWLAEYGVKGWDNAKDEKTNETVAFTRQAARQVFLRKEIFLSLNRALIAFASSYESYVQTGLYEDLEQLKKP